MTWSPTIPSEGGDPGDGPSKSRLAFRIGLTLIVASNGVYLLYILLPFLPIDATEMTGLAVGFSLASWGIFSLGVALAGKDGVTVIWQTLRRWVGRPPS